MKPNSLLPALAILVFAVVLRLVPHPPNVAPITAMALFGGAYLNKKYALILPIGAMFVSDLVLGFHSTIPFVYGSFLLVGFLGLWLKARRNLKTILGVTFLSSLLFFVITNFGVWLVGGLYPPTLSGLANAYILALPFFRNTLLGDFFYTGLFFGAYELARGLRWRFAWR